MRVSHSRLRKIIAEELRVSLSERKGRETRQGAGTEVATGGEITADVINEAELKAIGEDRVEGDQSITISPDSEPDIDFFGLTDVDEMHNFVTELLSGEILGSQGSATFTPWQPWGMAGKGESENTITWTLWNNVSSRDGAPDARGFVVVPNTIGLKKASVVAAEAQAAAQQQAADNQAETDYAAGIEAMVDASEVHHQKDRVDTGTEEDDFDDGLNKAIRAYNAHSKGSYSAEDGGLANTQQDIVKRLSGEEYSSVLDMIAGEFSGGALTDRQNAWNNSEEISESSSLSPIEMWMWVRSENILREQAEASEVETVEDASNTSSPGMEAYIERVEELLQGYPSIGWALKEQVEMPMVGPRNVPPVAYFFSKSSAGEAEELKSAGKDALVRVFKARQRDSPEDRETLAAIEAGAIQSRTGEAPAESEGEDAEESGDVSESIARSIIRQQLLIERA